MGLRAWRLDRNLGAVIKAYVHEIGDQMNDSENPGGRGLAVGGFAMVCGAWLIASLLVPTLPLWEEVSFYSILFSVGLTGGMWFALSLWAAIPAAAMILAIRRVLERRYGSAVGWSSVPAAGALLFFFATDIGDIVRFRLNKASYDQVVADARASKCSKQVQERGDIAIDGIDCDPITVIFTWGGFGSIWHGIVYDAGDEIIRSPQDRSFTWKNRPIGSLLSCSGAKRELGDHYYRAGGSYTAGKDDCG
jgi:hypothetical protein